ncbi:MAG: NAD(+) synthase [Clostridia bacterium]|nr:NAD(+) synthase [Clostridia bacterium]
MNCELEVKNRVNWLKEILANSGCKGFIYGNSGGKDCTLVGALCKLATDNVLGVIMPCESSRNYGQDKEDALNASKTFGIEQIEVDLTEAKKTMVKTLAPSLEGKSGDWAYNQALININPRLRMTTLYALAQTRGYLVAGTGNADEFEVGYFTKWGDGAYDVNPIADLTVSEIYELLRYLGAPEIIITKAPSAGLFEGQTDEQELGVTYADIDKYVKGEKLDEDTFNKIDKMSKKANHKKGLPFRYQR